MSNIEFAFTSPHNEPIVGTLLYVTKARYGGDWHSTPHTHHFAELFLVLRGTGTMLIEEKSVLLRQGDLIVLNPNVEHTERSTDLQPLEYIAVGIDGLSFLNEQEYSESSAYFKTSLPHDSDIVSCFESMVTEMERQESGYALVCQNTMQILLTKLKRLLRLSPTVTFSRRIARECSHVKRYIDTHFQQELTLDDLAAYSHMNKYYLTHSFTKYTGLSPISYLNRRRIVESCRLLENTNLSVAQIAGITGFSSLSYFSQVFKKTEGVSPAQYRKAMAQKREELSEEG